MREGAARRQSSGINTSCGTAAHASPTLWWVVTPLSQKKDEYIDPNHELLRRYNSHLDTYNAKWALRRKSRRRANVYFHLLDHVNNQYAMFLLLANKVRLFELRTKNIQLSAPPPNVIITLGHPSADQDNSENAVTASATPATNMTCTSF